MRGLKLFGMLAVAFTLVLAAFSCKEPGQTDADLADVLEAGEDLSGTWAVTMTESVKINGVDMPDMGGTQISTITFDDKDEAKTHFTGVIESVDAMEEQFKNYEDFTIRADAVINAARNKIILSYTVSFKRDGVTYEQKGEQVYEKQ
ncbi:MAG: hypothetical protein J1F14_03595 [Treponema sp.]|nr:hypothetical protein [Treponema sp.]